MIDVTLPLSEKLVEDAKRFGEVTQRDMIQVLAEALEMMWATIAPQLDASTPISTLADDEILGLANAKMELSQNERLGYLQTKGKANGLTPAEQTELLALIHIYQIGQLRKSQALAEAVQRGLQSPLIP